MDYDGTISEAERERRRDNGKKDGSQGNCGSHKLGIGLGPGGVEVDPVSFSEASSTYLPSCGVDSFHHSGSTAIYAGLTIQY